jgi:hypothetical protein
MTDVCVKVVPEETLVDVTDSGSVLVTTAVVMTAAVCDGELLNRGVLAEDKTEADVDGAMVRVVVVVMTAVTVAVDPETTAVDVYVTGTVVVTVKGVVMGTMAVAVDVVATAVVPVVHRVDVTVNVEPYTTVVEVTVAKAEVVRVVVVKTGTSEVELMAIVNPERVVLDPGTDCAVLLPAGYVELT